MARTVSIYDADPDFRKTPKTDDWCWRCQKDLKPGQARRHVRIVAGGVELAHPDDMAVFDNTPGDCGCFPVGADCARKMKKLIGDDFTFDLAT